MPRLLQCHLNEKFTARKETLDISVRNKLIIRNSNTIRLFLPLTHTYWPQTSFVSVFKVGFLGLYLQLSFYSFTKVLVSDDAFHRQVHAYTMSCTSSSRAHKSSCLSSTLKYRNNPFCFDFDLIDSFTVSNYISPCESSPKSTQLLLIKLYRWTFSEAGWPPASEKNSND